MSLLSGDQIFINILVVWIIQLLKKSNKPFLQWINYDSPTVSKIVASVGAILTTAGITFAWVSDSGTLTITGLTAGGFATVIAEILKNYAFQHVIYQTAFKPGAQLDRILDAAPGDMVPAENLPGVSAPVLAPHAPEGKY